MMVVAASSGVVLAGPLDKNAASKANGDPIGHPQAIPTYNNYITYGANRSFSYNPAPQPAPAPSASATPAPPVQAAPAPQAPAVAQTPVRRYSYQPQPMTRRSYSYGTQSPQPLYLRVDKKVLAY